MKPAAFKQRLGNKVARYHGHTPLLRKLPLPAVIIILALALVNGVVWVAVGIVLVRNPVNVVHTYLELTPQ